METMNTMNTTESMDTPVADAAAMAAMSVANAEANADANADAADTAADACSETAEACSEIAEVVESVEIEAKPRCGLVMEGGSMRGLFTCGVIDTFMEHGIDFDGAAGTSAGATFGCNIKSRQIGRALRYNKRFCKDKRYASFLSLIKTGDLFGEEFCYHDIPFVYDIWDMDAFAANPMEFYCAATDVMTGKPVYYKFGDGGVQDIRWIQASASMPLLANIVDINGRQLLDGGIADSIPVRFMQRMGYERNVVILTQPRDYEKKPNALMPAIRMKYRKYPKFVAACENRHERYNATLRYIEQEEAKGNLYVIRPPHKLNIGKLERNPDKLQKVYDIGRLTAIECLDSIRELGFCK